MDASIISALAALAGAAIGGLTGLVDSTGTGNGAGTRAGQTSPARALQRIHRGGFENLWRRAPARQTRCFRPGRDLHKNQQNARPVVAEGGRKRRTSRPNDCRYVFGAKRELLRAAGLDGQRRTRPSSRFRRGLSGRTSRHFVPIEQRLMSLYGKYIGG